MPSTSGISARSSRPYRWLRHPVTMRARARPRSACRMAAMCPPSHLAGRLVWGLTVAALLLGTLPVEGAVQLVQQSQEPEKAVSCTVGGAPSARVARDPDIPIPDGPRVAAGE